jgi:KipI family sensor histidine kinase inhibitor
VSAGEPRIHPLGDAALTIVFATDADAQASRRVRGLAALARRTRLPGVTDIVPGSVTLTLHYDPLEIDYASLRDLARELTARAAAAAPPEAGRLHVVPVRYDGPDLADVARRLGLPVREVIALHASRDYEVAFLGFVPGFAYLDGLNQQLVLPRRETPRTRVPAGSVAMAGRQTAIYPAATPGGWHLLGTTPVVAFDASRTPPALFQVGDRVRFVPEPG